jgi:hypothetical protein
MNWEELVYAISDLVRDADTRSQIYDRLLENINYNDEEVRAAFEIDSAFDSVASLYIEDEDFDEEDEDGYSYDDE